MPHRRRFRPGIPQADAAQEEEHIDSDVATSPQAEKSIAARQRHMEEDDKDDGGPHQLSAVAAQVGQLYFFQFAFSFFLKK